MVKLFLIFAMSLSFIQASNSINLFNQNNAEGITGGVITMEDIILHITLNDPNQRIELIAIKTTDGQIIDQQDGCYGNSCDYDIYDLVPGTYIVSVITNEGIFSATVKKD